MTTFQLAACAEMLWRDKPIEWRASRLKDMGFGVGLWNWPDHDLAKLEKAGANFTIMNGYLVGRLADDEGADMLLKSARGSATVAFPLRRPILSRGPCGSRPATR
jgi:hydroxypyruvate isomerase